MADEAKSIRYHPLFDCDIREAAGWYDRRASGLGDVFVEKVRATIARIVAAPLRFSRTTSGDCRYARVVKFPYVVLFDVDADDLMMLAVLHTARDIGKWRERLDPSS